jgi:hypothetical protein
VICESVSRSKGLALTRNRIQFQKGLSEARFLALYGDEDKCHALVAAWRWPDGFVCPKCGGNAHCIVLVACLRHDGPRKLFQCNGCRRQTSVTAGTIFNATKAPLTTWFRAMDLITQTKQGILSIAPGRRLRTTQTTAWKIKTKLAEVMWLAKDDEPLDGRVEMDDAHLGGKLARLKIRRIARFKRRRVKQLAKRIIAVGATVVTYGLSCFRGLADAGCDHIALPTETGLRAVQHASFQWVNRMIINIKTAVVGTYKSVSKKHMVPTLAEFEWRFNHRENLASMIPVLACAGARTKPKPYWYLKRADYGA